MPPINAADFKSFSELENHYRRDIDFQVHHRSTNSPVAIIAPHGGKIETATSEIARDIAGKHLNFYIFEGMMRAANYQCLHLSSRKFDDEQCLSVIRTCRYVLSIHGCVGQKESIYLGGLDRSLKQDLHKLLSQSGFHVQYDHPNFLGSSKRNICNRGFTGAGVQIELTKALRLSDNRFKFSEILRGYLPDLM